MGIMLNQAKQKWNADRYTQVKVSVPHELAAAFKDKCLNDGVSMASEIASFMRQKTEAAVIKKTVPDIYGTRQKRRKAVALLNVRLNDILDAEQRYLDNIPYNLQSSHFYGEAELTVAALEEAPSIISEAYQYLL